MIDNTSFGVKIKGFPFARRKNVDSLIEIKTYEQKRGKSKYPTFEIKYDKEKIESEYPNKKLDPIAEDLVNIALATFAADLLVSRDVLVPNRTEGRLFTRKIQLTVPVNKKDLWVEICRDLEGMVSFMTYDNFSYKFIKRGSTVNSSDKKDTKFDSICLFSGGIDSLAGGKFLTANEANPILLSINHGGIGKIIPKLAKEFSNKVRKIIITVDPDFRSAEGSQFSRSFLYLAFALAIAKAHKRIKRIYIPENAIIGHQIGLNEGRYGTRTVHPKFIQLFNSLIKKSFNEELEIVNPFALKTKGEVVRYIHNKKAISETISCANYRRFGMKHCGMCMPCLVRFIALASAKLGNKIEISPFGFNPFLADFSSLLGIYHRGMKKQTEIRYRDGVVNLLDLVRLAYEIKKLSYLDIIRKYPDFSDKTVYDTYVRFSSEVIKALDYYSNKNKSMRVLITKFSG